MNTGVAPVSWSICAVVIATGVLPVPPTVRLPMQITGTLARYGSLRRLFQATLVPYRNPSGASAVAAIVPPGVLRHQNSGGRMAQQCLNRRTRFSQCTAQCRDCLRCRYPLRAPQFAVGKPSADKRNDLRAALHTALALGCENCFVHAGEVLRVRAGDHRTPEFCRFEWILSPVRHEASTHEGEGGDAVEDRQFADRIGDVHCGVDVGQLVLGTPRMLPLAAQHGNFWSTSRMPRDDYGEQVVKLFPKRIVRGKNGFVLARMCASGQQHRSTADGILEFRRFRRIERRRWRVRFEIAGNRYVPRPE